MPAKISLIGHQFGRLKVIAEAPNSRFPCGSSYRRSICVCSCGKTVTVNNVSLRTGNTQSCGCLHDEMVRARFTTHGHTPGRKASKTYQSWACMIQRCTNPKVIGFKHYGGRGITVCPRWFEFSNFLEDMGLCPPNHSIGRIDNNAGYTKENCRWETVTQQNRNRRSNRVITFNGLTACIKTLCEHFGLPYKRTVQRLRLGWTVAEAFHPVKGYQAKRIRGK